MKTFHFRLQRIRDLRHAREKDRLTELGREQKQLAYEEQRLDIFRGEAGSQLNEMKAERGQPFKVWRQTVSLRYMHRVDRVIEYQSARVVEQTHAVEKARDKYLDARRDTSILDRLREKKFGEWKRDELREEGKLLDEIGSRKRDGDQP
ncbi:flagellar export protein FliJ [bacterium]|nr:flagellar export protein FliJ [bacterium]MBU1983899.1 flagellar export protein FliJ [bacterium]